MAKGVNTKLPKNMREGQISNLNLRHCHDCGAKTFDYRCPKCLRKWREKNKVGIEAGGRKLSYAR